MLTVICGEDSVSSYDYSSSLKKKFIKKNIEVIHISSNDLENIPEWMGETQSLFSPEKVFFTRNLNKRLSRKLSLKINKIVDGLIKNKSIEIFDWEEGKTVRDLKFPVGIVVKEFKPNENIFKLVDSIYPGNLNFFIKGLEVLSAGSDENFLFIMIARQIRNLILVKSGSFPPRMMSWQI